MKKTTKKSPKPSKDKAVKNLGVRPGKSGAVRGGITVTKAKDSSSLKVLNDALQGTTVKI